MADIRRRAAALGRNPADLLIFTLATVIPAETDAAARDKLAEYRRHIDHEGALALFSGWTGIDFSGVDPDEPIRYIKNDAMVSAVESFTTADPDRVWTIREIAEHVGIGGRGPVFVGSAATIADEMQGWVAETGIDGFNLAYAVAPESFVDFVDLVVPELQRRGAFKQEYAPGTYREKLFGAGRARLPDEHPAARWRR